MGRKVSSTSINPTETRDTPTTLDGHAFYGLNLDEHQTEFRNAIWDPGKLIIFCDSRAGTGKTLIATATADLLCQYNLYQGIIYIASPCQEQRQGYLSGSLEEKSIPYFEPFYQALLKLDINPNTAVNTGNILTRKSGTGYIECMTHTFKRGTNLENKVIIIDEAQNYYQDELLKVLTRISDDCKTIVIGHRGQCDLYKNPERTGFVNYMNWYDGDPRTAVCSLTVNYRGWVSSHADALPLPYQK